MPNETNIRKWTAALRSGEYVQMYHAMANYERTKYCCLGVACEVAIKAGVNVTVSPVPRGTSFDGAVGAWLPNSVSEWLGIPGDVPIVDPHAFGVPTPVAAADANDTETPFSIIADAVEKTYLNSQRTD